MPIEISASNAGQANKWRTFSLTESSSVTASILHTTAIATATIDRFQKCIVYAAMMKTDLVLFQAPSLIKVFAAGRLNLQVILGWLVYCGSIVNMVPQDLLEQLLTAFNLFRVVTGLLRPFKQWIIVGSGSGTRHADIWIYIKTAVVVLMSYASLLEISMSYAWLVIFPLISFAFIAALCKAELCGDHKETAAAAGTAAEAEGELEALAAVPYWVLGAMGRQFDDDQAPGDGGRFAVSQFLLFVSSMLAALALMMAQLSLAGGASASKLLHRASLLTLLVTLHTLAAELLGEDVMLFCLPELVPALLWFTLQLHRDTRIIIVDKITEYSGLLLAAGGAVLAAFAYPMDEAALSRCTTMMASCGISGLLVYYIVFMLRQWPRQISAATTTSATLMEAVELFQLWANVMLIAAVVLLLESLATIWLGLPEPVALLTRLLNDYVHI